MALLTRPIPGLFGGVSQQVPALRHPTQGDLQENATATLKEGLSKRPPFQHVAALPITHSSVPALAAMALHEEGAFFHVMDYGDAGRFLMVCRGAAPLIFNLETGVAATLDVTAGVGYFTSAAPRNDLRACTIADYTFVVNREVLVASSTTVSDANPTNVAYFLIKQAVAEQTVAATVNGVMGNYTTSGAGPHTVDSIANGLATALGTALGAGYTVTVLYNQCVKVVKASGNITTWESADTWGQTMIQTLNEGVEKYSDLPAKFVTGYTIKVTATANSSDDDYYVKWDGSRWVETKQPGLSDTLTASTMPVAIVRTGTNAFAVQIPTWDKRLVGDENSNPMPSFVGKYINDVFFHRNRLGFLCLDAAILSAAGKFFRFFGETARTVLDGDPIDITAASPENTELDRAVEFNEAMLAFGQKGQFVLTGADDILSPKNARLAKSTAYECNLGVKPVYFGNEVAYATSLGDYTAVQTLRASAKGLANEADELTSAVTEYIAALPRCLAVSTVAKRLAISTINDPGITVFKFEKEGGEWKQRAWDYIPQPDTATYTNRIVHMHWVEHRLYVVRIVTEGTAAAPTDQWATLEYIDFQLNRSYGALPFVPRLDRLVAPTSVVYSAGTTKVKLPYKYVGETSHVFLRLASGATDPVALVPTGIADDPGNIDGCIATFTGDVTLADSVWMVGVKYNFRYRFTQMVMVDGDGRPVEASRTRVKHLLLKYSQTGYFKAVVTPYLRDTYEYPFSGRVVGVPGLGLGQAPVSSGLFKVPVGSDPFGTTVEIQSDSFYPCTFPYAEWVPDVQMRAKR